MSKNNYDFIEIGTCFFDTLIEKATMEKGLSIDPIEEYLNKLPDKQNVTKVIGAVVPDDNLKFMDVYFVSEEDIKKNKLPFFMHGCNTVGVPHEFHTSFYPNSTEWHLAADKSLLMPNTRNLIKEGIVSTRKVKCYTYKELMEQFNIGHVKFLKTDTDGSDCRLLHSILDYYDEVGHKYLPKKIEIETSSHTPEEEFEPAQKRMAEYNYDVVITFCTTTGILKEA